MADLFDTSKQEKQPLAARMPSKKRPPAFSFSRVFHFVKNSDSFIGFLGSGILAAKFREQFPCFANFVVLLEVAHG